MGNKLEISIFNRYRNQLYKEQLTRWELTKSYKDYTVQIDLSTPFRFDNKTAYRFLLDMALGGPYNLENTAVTDTQCGVSIPANVYGVEGKADHKNMIFEKTPDLNGELRFTEKANIFDYDSETLTVFNGSTETRYYQALETRSPFIDNYSEVLSLLNVPNYEGEGFYITTVELDIEAKLYTDPQLDLDFFSHYEYKISAIYTKYESSVYIEGWLPLGNVFVYPFPPLQPRRIVLGRYSDGYLDLFHIVYRGKTKVSEISDQTISNARNFGQLLAGIFGPNYISNWFNVNPDSSEPSNKYYDFAAANCSDLRIIQGRDVTNSKADEDSFANSGKIDSKKLIADLNTMFNLTLVYDSTTEKIRHEHISYWRSKRITLTDYSLSEYQFNSQRVSSEAWTMPVISEDSDHTETSITYRTEGQQDEKYTVELLLTDTSNFIDTARDEIEDQDKLFFLVATDGAGNVTAFNNPLAIRNLVQKLHDLNRPSRHGVQDNDNVTFVSTSVGLEAEITTRQSLSSFLAVHPQMAVVVDEGTFYIEELTIDQDGVMTIPVRK